MQNMESLVSLKDGAFTPGVRHGIQDLKGYEEVSILEQTNGGVHLIEDSTPHSCTCSRPNSCNNSSFSN